MLLTQNTHTHTPTKAGNLPKSNALCEIAEKWTEECLYSFMSAKGQGHNTSTYQNVPYFEVTGSFIGYFLGSLVVVSIRVHFDFS